MIRERERGLIEKPVNDILDDDDDDESGSLSSFSIFLLKVNNLRNSWFIESKMGENITCRLTKDRKMK